MCKDYGLLHLLNTAKFHIAVSVGQYFKKRLKLFHIFQRSQCSISCWLMCVKTVQFNKFIT